MKKIITPILIVFLVLALIFNVKQYNQLKGIEKEVETISSEIETLQGTILEKDTVISEKDSKIEELEENVEVLQKEIKELKEQITNLDTKKEALSKQIEKVSTTGTAAETNPQQGGGSANYSGDNLPQLSPEEVARQLGITYGGDGSQNPNSGYDGPPLF